MTKQQLELLEKIQSFSNLKPDWNNNESDIPNQVAIEKALEVVDCAFLLGVPVERVDPSEQSGVVVSFKSFEDGYSQIECSNESVVLGLIDNRTEGNMWHKILFITNYMELIIELTNIKNYIKFKEKENLKNE